MRYITNREEGVKTLGRAPLHQHSAPPVAGMRSWSGSTHRHTVLLREHSQSLKRIVAGTSAGPDSTEPCATCPPSLSGLGLWVDWPYIIPGGVTSIRQKCTLGATLKEGLLITSRDGMHHLGGRQFPGTGGLQADKGQ